MGGALMLISIGITTLLWADLSNRFIWVTLIVTLGFGMIGWIDDYRKVVHGNPKGMSAREKYAWQSAIGLAASFYLAFAIAAPSTDRIGTDAPVDHAGFLHRPSASLRSAGSVFQEHRVSARRVRFHRAVVPGNCRNEQCGESD